MSTTPLANVPDLPSVIQDGTEVHDNHFMDNSVMLRAEAQLIVDAVNSVIDDAVTLDAKVENYNDAAVLADAGMLDRLDTLEAEVAGTLAEGATIGNVRVGLEDGLIETDDGTDLSVNGIPVSQDNEIGLMTRPATWQAATPANGNAIAIGGKVICYGQQISDVMRLPLAYGSATYPLSLESLNCSTFIIRTGTDINIVTIPATSLVPLGVEIRFINYDTNDASKVFAGVTVNYMDYLHIKNTAEGWMVIGSGTSAVVT